MTGARYECTRAVLFTASQPVFNTQAMPLASLQLFDLVMVRADKPRFYTKTAPFRELDVERDRVWYCTALQRCWRSPEVH